MKVQQLLLSVLLIVAFIAVTGSWIQVARAAGFVGFATATQVNMASGAQVDVGAPQGTIHGFSTHPAEFYQTLPDSIGMEYAVMSAMGIDQQRTDLVWKNIQSTSSESYRWNAGSVQDIVDRGITAGINTTLIIAYAPTWAAHAGCDASTSNCAPADPAVFATFCGAAATHFDGKVTYWEIWNEPNLDQYWGPVPDVTEYTAALNPCYDAIKAVNPDNQVLAPALSTGGDIVPQTFITQMYTMSPKFDILSLHPYSYPYDALSSSGGFNDIEPIRATMISNGDSAKPIWITEYGVPTCGTGTARNVNYSGSFGSGDYMTFQAQKQIAESVLTYLSTHTYITNFFWYTPFDFDSLVQFTNENCFGVFYTNGKPKPIYEVLRNH